MKRDEEKRSTNSMLSHDELFELPMLCMNSEFGVGTIGSTSVCCGYLSSNNTQKRMISYISI